MGRGGVYVCTRRRTGFGVACFCASKGVEGGSLLSDKDLCFFCQTSKWCRRERARLGCDERRPLLFCHHAECRQAKNVKCGCSFSPKLSRKFHDLVLMVNAACAERLPSTGEPYPGLVGENLMCSALAL